MLFETIKRPEGAIKSGKFAAKKAPKVNKTLMQFAHPSWTGSSHTCPRADAPKLSQLLVFLVFWIPRLG